MAAATENVLRGAVHAPDGTPLAGATVTLSTHGTGAIVFVNEPIDRSKDFQTETNETGTFEFRGVPSRDRYRLTAEHAGYARTSVLTGEILVTEVHEELPLVMQAGTRLHGTISDVEGKPVSGASLHLDGMFVLVDGEPADRRVTTSDAHGTYEFLQVPRGNEHWTLNAERSGYVTKQRRGLIFRKDQESMEIEFQLEQQP
jgi:hypothetical protein